MYRYTLSFVRAEIEKFISELENEYYLNFAGLKREFNIARIYKKYSHLTSKEFVEFIRKKLSEKRTDRRLEFLERFAIENYMELFVKELTQEIVENEAKATIKLDGRTVPYRYGHTLLANETRRQKRRKIFELQNKVIETLNPIRIKRLKKMHAVSKELGFENYANLYQKLKKVDFKNLCAMLEKFAANTDSLYETVMGDALAKIGLSLTDAKRFDILYLYRAEKFDRYFSKQSLLPILYKTLYNLGFDLKRQTNILIDSKPRKYKSARAFVAPIRPPADVRLVIMPQGGWNDYDSIFHECGHAEHYGNIRKNLPVEYKHLGDTAVTESFAFLFQYLITNPYWLKQYIGMPERAIDEYVKFAYMRKLYFLRRYLAKLNYELKLHTAVRIERLDAEYASILKKYLKFEHPASHYLTDLDDGFYCVAYLSAWLFEVMLRLKLESTYGVLWFKSKPAGSFLKSLWRDGSKYSIEELAKKIGYTKGIDASYLTEDIIKTLG